MFTIFANYFNTSHMVRSILLWIFTFFFTVGIAVYQRTTGPTYPVKGKTSIANTAIDYQLLRSHGGETDAPIDLIIPNSTVTGKVIFRKFKSSDPYTTLEMVRHADTLRATLPNQPPAGKLEYKIMLSDGTKEITLQENPTVIRFKGAVPNYYLIPHIILMFFAMMFSTRTGLEMLFKGKQVVAYTTVTLITLLIGGLILGPIVQEYAFGDFWTGWPFGHDMTDNKTLVAFVFWLIAYIKVRKKKKARGWVIAAAIILLAIYLIPHSMFGSELNYETGQVETGK